MPLTETDHIKFLESIEPFRAMPPAEIQHLAQGSRSRDFPRGEIIFNEGDDADSVWILVKGRVQVFRHISSGKPLAVESLGRGEIFGTLCRLGGEGRNYPCSVQAAEPCTVLRLPDSLFLHYFGKSPGLMRGICALCCQRLKDVQDLRCMGQEPVPVRLASILMRLRNVHGDILPFTKKEIAELIGTTPESTFRIISELQKKKIVVSLRRKIQIKNIKALEVMAENA